MILQTLLLSAALAQPRPKPIEYLHCMAHYWLRPRQVATFVSTEGTRIFYANQPTTLRTWAEFAMVYKGGIGPVPKPPEPPPPTKMEVMAMFAEMLFMEE